MNFMRTHIVVSIFRSKVTSAVRSTPANRTHSPVRSELIKSLSNKSAHGRKYHRKARAIFTL